MSRSSSIDVENTIPIGESSLWSVPGDHQPFPTGALPKPPNGKLIGRQRELEIVLSTVEEQSTQLLTILGPGGVGKTRLALAAAWELAPSFADGVAFLPFTTPDLNYVWQMIVQTLDISNSTSLPPMEALLEALASREMLIVLDNCEKITEAFSELPNLLAACPGVTIIATSQEALRIRGEQEFWLQPLELPKSGPEITVDIVEACSAVELFTHRAHQRDGLFQLNESNVSDVVAIVRMLDGLPLAIELGAAQLRHLSPAALRQRLQSALPSLSGGSRDLPERQHSLLNMMEWSLSLLKEDEQDQFLQLAVLTGDFSPETASRIMGLSPVVGWEMLISFADKSLIKRVSSDTHEPARFFMLQTVQAAALYLLEQRPDQYFLASSRHADACLAFAKDAAHHLHGTEHTEWLRRIEQEHPNLETAIERALSEPRLTQTVLGLAEPMFWFWYTRGYHTWALPRLEQLLNNAPDNVSPDVRGSAHVSVGWLAFKMTQVDRAEHHFQEGVRLIADDTSPVSLRGATGIAYAVAFEGKNTTEAINRLRQVTELARTNPAAWHELVSGLFGIALTEYFAGQIAPAREGFEAALQIARSHDDQQSTAMSLLYLAHIDRVDGNPQAAIRRLQKILPIFLDIGGESNVLLSLEVVVSLLADLGEARMARRFATVIEHMRRSLRVPRSPREQEDFDKAMAQVRKDLSLDENEEIDAPGVALSIRDVVDEFLQYHPTTPDQPASVNPVAAVLSRREMEVLWMVAAGKTSSDIAAALYVSPHTVKRHMANIRVKLGVRTQAAAVAALQRSR